ncbi:hypothetical protein H2204_012766 [Knufia peltigerae]|uniref:Amidohydrolase-related domain-containing protein n=1 Tax=Knufia peltigerae TaxID=1002370 RepID=A0AA38XSU3_9EURO|nr:hypothetical protein H2204_012766 [Knufia peltigerae]
MTRRKVTFQPDPTSSTTTTTTNASTDTHTRNVSHAPPADGHHHHNASATIPIPSQPSDESKVHLISTSLLIPGRGEPRRDMTVMIRDGVIHAIHPTSSPPAFLRHHSLPATRVPVLLPGLWDCHTHFLGTKSLNLSEVVTTHPAVAGARLARNARDILLSGFTSVRDLGGYAIELARAISDSGLPGPHVYSAGAAISQTSGHGDLFDLPVDVVHSRLSTTAPTNPASYPLVLADGADACRLAVRLVTRRGARCVKVFTSGGVLSILDDPMRGQYSAGELEAIVDEATRAGLAVAAHCHGKPGILAALRAGCHTIEHGTYLDRECVDLMLAKEAVFVPTRTVVKVGVDHPELMSPESYAKMLETAKHHRAAYRLAVRSGVKVALGTDLGVSAPVENPMALGRSGGELAYAVTDGGMTPLQAIEAATATGPETLGHLGAAPKSGQIREGYDADLIAMCANPLEDDVDLDDSGGGEAGGMDLFKNPKNITHVWKGGVCYKKP